MLTSLPWILEQSDGQLAGLLALSFLGFLFFSSPIRVALKIIYLTLSTVSVYSVDLMSL